LTDVLFLRCKENFTSYEFIFSAARSDPSVFRFFLIAHQNYASSTILREQRLRSSIVLDGNVVMLPDEQVILTLDGISNFAGDTAKVGKAIVTNFRFVWYSGIVSNFNVSIPLILLPPLKSTRSSRYGRALYLKFQSNHSSFLYGFTISPEEKLREFTRNFEQIRQAAVRMPRLTPPLDVRQRVVKVPEAPGEEDLVIIEANPAVRYLPCDLVGKAQGGAVTFDRALGLAVEGLPEGETLSERWRVASTTPLVGIDDM
jgi:Bardet-Biedl syndrome 5 protein